MVFCHVIWYFVTSYGFCHVIWVLSRHIVFCHVIWVYSYHTRVSIIDSNSLNTLRSSSTRHRSQQSSCNMAAANREQSKDRMAWMRSTQAADLQREGSAALPRHYAVLEGLVEQHQGDGSEGYTLGLQEGMTKPTFAEAEVLTYEYAEISGAALMRSKPI